MVATEERRQDMPHLQDDLLEREEDYGGLAMTLDAIQKCSICEVPTPESGFYANGRGGRTKRCRACCKAGTLANIMTTLFLANGARAGARQAREIAAALIACAEDAEATADQPVAVLA